MIEGQNCKNCVYSRDMDTVGSCYRRAPIQDSGGRTRWPQIFDDSWCGEWKPDQSIANQLIFGALDKRGRITNRQVRTGYTEVWYKNGPGLWETLRGLFS